MNRFNFGKLGLVCLMALPSLGQAETVGSVSSLLTDLPKVIQIEAGVTVVVGGKSDLQRDIDWQNELAGSNCNDLGNCAAVFQGAEMMSNTNTALISQEGDELVAEIRQNGNNNEATISQNGIGNRAKIVQDGTSNTASVSQGGTPGLVGAVLCGVLPCGDDNYALITQSGTGNSIELTQTGSTNDARLSQAGNDNIIELSQPSYDTSATITQTGNSNQFYLVMPVPGQSLVLESTANGVSIGVGQSLSPAGLLGLPVGGEVDLNINLLN